MAKPNEYDIRDVADLASPKPSQICTVCSGDIMLERGTDGACQRDGECMMALCSGLGRIDL